MDRLLHDSDAALKQLLCFGAEILLDLIHCSLERLVYEMSVHCMRMSLGQRFTNVSYAARQCEIAFLLICDGNLMAINRQPFAQLKMC